MGYLRESKFSPKHHWPFVLLAIFIPLATLASLVTLRFVPDTEGVNRFYNHLLTKITGSIDRGSIPMILEGVILVMLTLRLRPHSWRPVNYASKFILGIYLLHEGILFRFSRWTFGYFQHTVSFIQPNAWMPLTFLIVGFGLMMFCWLCEVVRYYCFQVPFEMVRNFGDKKFAKIDRYFDLCRGEETEKA